MDYKKILKYLYSLESPKIKLGLGRTQFLLDSIGNPEKKLKYIHVAGSNGKGSVCAMLQSILMHSGYKVGMYTSPHLKKFNERIRVNDSLITDKEIVDAYLKVAPSVSNQSFFEITTAMAFLYFFEKKCDYVILEVGLGGRLDSTNVIIPLVSVITNISLEHTNILGKTVEKIAFEKAGIIKQNVPIVTGSKEDALEVIRDIAKQKSAPLFLVKKHPKVDFKFLKGVFQQQNKDIALTTIDILNKNNKINLSKQQIISGIKNTKWPARFQFISQNVLIDGAHNTDGMKILKKELLILKKQKKYQNLIFVVGIQNTKNIEEMLRMISPLVSRIVFTKSNNEKSTDPKELLKIFKKINNQPASKIILNPKNALNYAKELSSKKDLIIVCGSLYMLGEVI